MYRRRIAVIGGVAAGPAAAAQAHRIDPAAEVVLFEQGADISYGACEMPYYIGGEIEAARDLVVLTPEQFAQSRGATVKTQHRVHSLQPERSHLTVENLADGSVRQERFDAFVLATGARARLPDLPGADAPNVLPVRTLDDAVRLRAFLKAHPVQHAVVLGGGYIGVEMAEALRQQQVRVTILEPGAGPLHTYLDATLQPLVRETLYRHGVTVRREQPTAFIGHPNGHVSALTTDRGERIGCQLVVVAMGIRPNTDLATTARIRLGKTGAIAVNAQMRTNRPNVWACGDCVEVERRIDGKKIHLPLAPVAFRTARVAGHNAARHGRGGPMTFPGVCSASAVKVFELEVGVAGLRLEEAQAAGFDAFAVTVKHLSRSRLYPGAKPLHVRLVVARNTGQLLGGELVGHEGAALRANVLVPLLRAGASVEALRDADLIYTPPFAPAHDPLLVAAHAAMKQRHRRTR